MLCKQLLVEHFYKMFSIILNIVSKSSDIVLFIRFKE